MFRVVKRRAAEAGSCMNCRDGYHIVVLEFNLGGFVARLCTSCFEDLAREGLYVTRSRK